MGLIGTIKTFSSGESIVASDFNTINTTFKTVINGNLTDDNINASAAISWSKISKTSSAFTDIVTRSGSFTAYAAPKYVDKGNVTGTTTITWSAGNVQKATLTGNTTISFSSPANFQSLMLILVQDSTGSRTVTWPSSIRWLNGTGATDSTTDKPVLTTTGDKFDVIYFYYDSDLSLYIGNVAGQVGAIT